MRSRVLTAISHVRAPRRVAMKVALSDGEALGSSRPPPSLCDARGFLLLAVLPFCNIGGFVWCYTALPLHWVDSDWPLWQLSTLMFITYVPRVCTTVLTGRVGDWICVPISGIAAGCSILMIMRPDSPAAVWVAMSAISCAVNPPALRSLVHKRFQGSGTWQMQRALRMYTLADAIGYACAPFIGGVLYDTRGLAACAAFSCVTNSACALLTFHLLGCREAPVVRVRPDQSPGTSEAGTDHGSSQAEGARCNSAHPAHNGAHMKAEANAVVGVPVTRAYYGWPLSVLMVAAYTNICVYAVEWNLYALYFRIEHDWSGTWCGFCQMISELIGAAVLGASTMTCVATGARCWNCPRAGIALMRPPFGIAVVLGSHGVLMIMLAQPQFVASLLGQVLMGTAYLFGEQLLQEALLLLSHGNHSVYRHFVFIHYLVFMAGCALASPIAFGLYDSTGSFASVFYASAAFAFAIGALQAVYFGSRLARTPAGVLGDMAAAEELLRQQACSRNADSACSTREHDNAPLPPTAAGAA